MRVFGFNMALGLEGANSPIAKEVVSWNAERARRAVERVELDEEEWMNRGRGTS